MPVKTVPIVAALIAEVQAVTLRHTPINKRVNVALALISFPFKTELLIGGNADILHHVILLSQRTQKLLARLIFQS